jgi:hypothetical protein
MSGSKIEKKSIDKINWKNDTLDEKVSPDI